MKDYKINKVLVLELNDFIYKMIRLNSDQYAEFAQHSLAIFQDYSFYLDLHRAAEKTKENLNLAQIYASLRRLTGECSLMYDNWKGSFSFPFLLNITADSGNFHYLLNIYDTKGSLEFEMAKIIMSDQTEQEIEKLHTPFEQEWPRKEINNFIGMFYFFLVGYFSQIKQLVTQPFVMKVPVSMILYGYKDGIFFQHEYDSPEEFDQACNEIGNLEQQWQISRATETLNRLVKQGSGKR